MLIWPYTWCATNQKLIRTHWTEATGCHGNAGGGGGGGGGGGNSAIKSIGESNQNGIRFSSGPEFLYVSPVIGQVSGELDETRSPHEAGTLRNADRVDWVSPRFIGFHSIWSRSNTLWLGFTGFYRVLPSLLGLYRVWSCCTGFYLVWISFGMVSLRLSVVFLGFIGFRRLDEALQDWINYTNLHWVQTGLKKSRI